MYKSITRTGKGIAHYVLHNSRLSKYLGEQVKNYPIVSSVGDMIGIEITGNVIPNSWHLHIVMDAKYTHPKTKETRRWEKPDAHAILLLADIVYWYRPVEMRDEETGVSKGYAQKFAADKLQRSYEAFADRYGLSKKQVKRALENLQELGVIDLEFRNIHIKGNAVNNVLYIGLDVEKLAEITHQETLKEGPTYFKGNTTLLQSEERVPSKDIGPDFKGGTNTENTQQINSETSQRKVRTAQKQKVESTNPYFEENRELLKSIESSRNGEGIWEKTIPIIADAPKTNPRFIKTVCAKWERKNGGMDIPLLITMLDGDAPVPTEEEDRQRYINCEFAEFIDH